MNGKPRLAGRPGAAGRATLLMLLFLLFAAGIAVSCARPRETGVRNVTFEQVQTIMDRHVADLMKVPGVVGVSIGALEDKTWTIQILVKDSEAAGNPKLPKEIEGVPVVVEVTGEIRPLGS